MESEFNSTGGIFGRNFDREKETKYYRNEVVQIHRRGQVLGVGQGKQ